jgi:hypothetical protein
MSKPLRRATTHADTARILAALIRDISRGRAVDTVAVVAAVLRSNSQQR